MEDNKYVYAMVGAIGVSAIPCLLLIFKLFEISQEGTEWATTVLFTIYSLFLIIFGFCLSLASSAWTIVMNQKDNERFTSMIVNMLQNSPETPIPIINMGRDSTVADSTVQPQPLAFNADSDDYLTVSPDVIREMRM